MIKPHIKPRRGSYLGLSLSCNLVLMGCQASLSIRFVLSELEFLGVEEVIKPLSYNKYNTRACPLQSIKFFVDRQQITYKDVLNMLIQKKGKRDLLFLTSIFKQETV